MSSKDYAVIAAEIRDANQAAFRASSEAYAAVSAALERVAFGLADVFDRDNPRFDAERFTSACGF